MPSISTFTTARRTPLTEPKSLPGGGVVPRRERSRLWFSCFSSQEPKRSGNTKKPEKNTSNAPVNPPPRDAPSDDAPSDAPIPLQIGGTDPAPSRGGTDPAPSREDFEEPLVKRVECRTIVRPYKQMFTLHDKFQAAIQAALNQIGLPAHDISGIILEFHALYEWLPSNGATTQIPSVLCHGNTISRNVRCLFGVINGSLLDPDVDHVINIRIDDGVEFGFGVCSEANARMDKKRDFMCEKGGWGYYNYKPKFVGMKPKYPAGWYTQTHQCVGNFDGNNVLMCGDVLTMTVTRQGLLDFDRGVWDGPCEGNGKHTLRFYKNNISMGHEIRDVQGKLSICLNYYFMSTTVRLLSDHKNSMKALCHELRRD